MRLFLYECISAGALGADVPTSLRQEGAAMLDALTEDFQRIAGVHVTTLHADEAHRSIDEPTAFRRQLAQADAALIIAPEFDRLLADRTGWAEDAGCRVLGCTRAAVQLTGDKLRLAAWLTDRGLPTPATCLASSMPQQFPCVLKPRDGAGSQATRLVRSGVEWSDALRQARLEWPRGDFIVQPFHPGRPVSVAFLIGSRQIVATPGATQRLSDDGCFRYLGGSTPLPPDLRARAIALGRRAVASIRGLQGYVGVDLILGEAESGDVVVEINPRLTTSYIGLRQLTRMNLADVWLRLWRGEVTPDPDWSNESIDFSADGSTGLAV